METDYKTAWDRVGSFYDSHYRVSPITRKIICVGFVIALSFLAITMGIGKMIDNSLKAQTLNNLVQYHNPDGFQPVR